MHKVPGLKECSLNISYDDDDDDDDFSKKSSILKDWFQPTICPWGTSTTSVPVKLGLVSCFRFSEPSTTALPMDFVAGMRAPQQRVDRFLKAQPMFHVAIIWGLSA